MVRLMWKTVGLSLIAMLLWSPVGFGATKYVGPSGSASWSNCNSTSTLCSIGTALAEADDGDIVNILAGTYTRAGTGDRTRPAFNPSNSGSSGAYITFQAYPDGAYVYMTLSSGSGPVIGGGSSVSYFIWKGITAQEGSNFLTDSGTVSVWGGNHKIIDSCNIIGRTRYQQDNHDGVRMENTSSNTIRNCWIHGYTGNGWNNTGIKLYGSSYNTVEYCTFTENALGIFDKRGDNIYNEYRYNLYYNNGLHFKCYSNTAYDSYGHSVHHSIFLATNSSIPTSSLATASAIYFGGYGGESNFSIYNNVFYDVENTYGTGALELLNFGNNVRIWNNIFMDISNRVLCIQQGDFNNGDISYEDYNQFYNISSTDAFRIYGVSSHSLTSWAGLRGYESHRQTTNPGFDQASGTDDEDYQRSSYPTDGRGGDYDDVIGAFQSDSDPTHVGQDLEAGSGPEPDTTPPTLTSAVIDVTGLLLTIGLSEDCTGNSGFTLTPQGEALTASYASGTGNGRVYDLSRQVLLGETITLAYSEASGDIVDAADNEIVGFSGMAITNNSTYELPPNPNNLRFYGTWPKLGTKRLIIE